MRAAVVGGGVFGATAAVELARSGAQVDLYERHRYLMDGASRTNQGRLHSGYHYPRSPETARACMAGAIEFAERFPDAIDRSCRHHYCVAYYGRTSGPEYLDFLRELGLPYHGYRSPLTHRGSVAVTVEAPEAFINLRALRMILTLDLQESGVQVHRANVDTFDTFDSYDLVVDATYGQSGFRTLRFEVVEIALIRLGAHYRGQSFVVMDGDFVSLDPFGDMHMIYDVAHSVHAANVGTGPEVPPDLALLVDRGVVPTDLTHVDDMLATARRFLVNLGLPQYVGSMFTVRAVLPDVDATDARPTLVERDGNVVRILGGKLDTAVAAARQVVAMQAVPA